MNGCARDPAFDPRSVKTTLNRWIAGEAAKAVAEVQLAIEGYRFNDAAGAVYRFVWNIVCDWYLELAKPVLSGADEATAAETRAMVAFVLDQSILMLHPFMPFITEELWSMTAGEGGRDTVAALAPWPDLGALRDAEAEAEIGWLVDIVTEIRSIRTEIGVPGGAMVPLVMVDASDDVIGRYGRLGETLKRLARLSDVTFTNEAPRASVQLTTTGATAALALEGVVDINAEKSRLAKEIGRIEAEISKIDAKLGNPDFLARAKEEVVEEQRERREEATARLSKLQSALDRL
jgi:valyl-tRNA synthetase